MFLWIRNGNSLGRVWRAQTMRPLAWSGAGCVWKMKPRADVPVISCHSVAALLSPSQINQVAVNRNYPHFQGTFHLSTCDKTSNRSIYVLLYVWRLTFCLRSRPVDPNVVSPSVSRNVENRRIMTCNWVTEWPSGQVTEWPSDQVTEWPSDRVTKWQSDRVTKWPKDQLTK